MLFGDVIRFAAGFLTALASTPLMRLFAWKISFLSESNPIVGEARAPVAYLGGIAITMATAICAILLQYVGWSMTWLLREIQAALPLTMLGLVDDALVLKPLHKAILQTVCAGIGLGLLTNWHFDALFFIYVPLVVTIVNAVNFLDASDGFAAAAITASFLALALTSAEARQFFVLAGAATGFLLFNRPPASIYLGDAGSHFLGAMLAFAVIATLSPFSPPTVGKLVAIGLLMATPLFDIVFTTCARLAKGRPWWLGSRDHIVFRLRTVGYSKTESAGMIFLAQISLGMLAIWELDEGTAAAVWGLAVGIVAISMATTWLWRIDSG